MRSILNVAAVLDPPLETKINNDRGKNITNTSENIMWSKNTYPHVRGCIQIMIDGLNKSITTSFDHTKCQKGRIVDLENIIK